MLEGEAFQPDDSQQSKADEDSSQSVGVEGAEPGEQQCHDTQDEPEGVVQKRNLRLCKP